MKHHIFFLLVSILSFQACEDCTITELEGPDAFDCPELMANIGDACDDNDPNTTGDTVNGNCECVGVTDFDCPQLMLNIGDPCDDGNPDTENDMVDANCACTGEPVNNCEGFLLAMRAEVVENMLGNFFLDRSDKAPLDLISFTQLEPINDGTIQSGEAFPFQFSTLNPAENTYFYGVQYDSGTLIRL